MEKKVQKIISVWIDVSKDKNNICILSISWEEKHLEVQNNKEGNKKLISVLKKYKKEQVAIVMESTWSYHLPLAIFLYEEQFTVFVINPLITKKYLRSSIRKCKTDKTDAGLLAKIFFQEREIVEFIPNKKDILLKRKASLLHKCTKHHQSLSLAMKSFEDDCKKNDLVAGKTLEQMQNLLKELEKIIKILEKEIAELGNEKDYFELLTNIKWVSKVSASILLAFIWDKHFESKKALVAFAGLDVSVKRSWSSVFGKWRISKRWNSWMRKRLTHIAWWLIMHNEYFKKLEASYKEKGKHYHERLVIIARKFLHIIYAMMKYNSPFNPI